MIYGVDYYPEHWPKSRWATDVKMMQEAHMNVVRLAEFAWSKLEPKPGVYDFSWLDEAIDLMASFGIQVILCTPTATPPKWLMDQHPDIYPVDLYGQVKGFGTRRHYCASNPTYRNYSRQITKKMVAHYQGHSNVIAWQTDNELDAGCYCEACREGFQQWLKTQYGTIDALNEAWGTVFWSQIYDDFESVIAPRYASSDGFVQGGVGKNLNQSPNNHNPGLLLDYYRYQSDAVVDFQADQIAVLRAHTKLPITHNYMGHFSELNYYDLGEELDVIAWDNYPNNMWGKSDYRSVAMAHDLMRGIKNKNFWMMEQQSGPCGWQAMGDTPEPGQIRLWTYQALAHGAEAMVYFRWRPALFGTEQYWHGILDHDGVGRRRYEEVSGIGKELESFGALFENSIRKSPVALIKSYDNLWSHRIQPHQKDFDYQGLLFSYYQGVMAHQVPLDVTGVHVDFTSYQLVMMPAFNLMTDDILEKCEAYVQAGGHLLITFRSGTRHWDNSITEKTYPGYFGPLAGIELEEYDALNFGRQVMVKGESIKGQASMWCDVIVPKGAEVLATYDSHYYAGKPAITKHLVGKGCVYYVGCDLDQTALNVLMKGILESAQIQSVCSQVASGIEVATFETLDGENRRYCVFMNHTDTLKKVAVNQKVVSVVLAPKEAHLQPGFEGEMLLPPYEVLILEI